LVHINALTNLSALDLSSTQVTVAGLIQLNGLTKLAVLYIGETQFTGVEMKELRQAWPSLRISRWPSPRLFPGDE
jgi:hypothetical protein